MQHDVIMIIARVAMAALFVITGAQKIAFPARMAPLWASMGLPAFFGIFVGLFEVSFGIAFAAGFELRWVAWMLGGWCLVTAAMGHRFWAESDPVQKGLQLSNFLKNVGLAGAFLAFGYVGAATFLL